MYDKLSGFNIAFFFLEIRIELHTRKLAKLVGKRLFEELIDFRNSLAPDNPELSTYEKDSIVREMVLQSTLERARSGISLSTRAQSGTLGSSRERTRGPSFFGPSLIEPFELSSRQKKVEELNSSHTKASRKGMDFEGLGGHDEKFESSSPDLEEIVDDSSKHEASVIVSGPAVEVLRSSVKVESNERRLLTKELFELFLGSHVDEFMLWADPGGDSTL